MYVCMYVCMYIYRYVYIITGAMLTSNGPSLWYPICCWGDTNIGFTSLVLVREYVSPPVISSSLDICLVVSDVLLVLAGIGGGISLSVTVKKDNH